MTKKYDDCWITLKGLQELTEPLPMVATGIEPIPEDTLADRRYVNKLIKLAMSNDPSADVEFRQMLREIYAPRRTAVAA